MLRRPADSDRGTVRRHVPHLGLPDGVSWLPQVMVWVSPAEGLDRKSASPL
jgi:hypothetical protein